MCYTWWAEKSSLWPAINWAHFLINLIASMLVSGKAALHANSERHLIASWKMKDQISLNAWADRKNLERVHHGCELGFKHLCDNFTRCLRKNNLRLLSRTISKTWKASSTIFSSWSAAAMWKTEKILVHPDLMLCPCKNNKVVNWISN